MSPSPTSSSDRSIPISNDKLADIIKSIISDPQSNNTASLESQAIHTNASNDSSGHDTTSAKSGAASTQDIFSAFLSNPELLSKLPNIISSVKPIIELMSSSPSPPIKQEQPTASIISESVNSADLLSKPPHSADLLSKPPHSADLLSKPPHSADQRTALLMAIKPYLGHDRQNAIDYILKLSRLGSILKNL